MNKIFQMNRTYTFVKRESVYRPLVEEFLTTKHPSLSSCLRRDSALCLDISPTYHLKKIYIYKV